MTLVVIDASAGVEIVCDTRRGRALARLLPVGAEGLGAGALLLAGLTKLPIDSLTSLPHSSHEVATDARGAGPRESSKGARGFVGPIRTLRCPQCARVLFVLAVAAESGDQFDHCVKRGLQRLGVAFDLSEEQAALQGG